MNGFVIYMIGVVISCTLVSIHAYHESKKGEKIEEFPAMFSVMGILSWISVVFYIYRYIKFGKLF